MCRRCLISLRSAPWLFWLLIASVLHAPVAHAQADTVTYVLQPDNGAVVLIDGAAYERIGTISLAGLGFLLDLAATPDGKWLYVLFWNKLAVVDTASRVIVDLTDFQLDENIPNRITVTPNGAFLCLFGEDYDAIDFSGLQSTGGTSIPLGDSTAQAGAVAMRFSRDGRFAYALHTDHHNYDDNGYPITQVLTIDLASLQVVNTVNLSGYVSDFALSADNRQIYVGLGGSLAVLDTATGSILATIPINGTVSNVATSANGNLIFAAGKQGADEASGFEPTGYSVFVIDAATVRVTASFSVAGVPVRMIPTPDDTGLLLILNGPGASTLNSMEIATGALTPIADGAAVSITMPPPPPPAIASPTPVRRPVTGQYRAYVADRATSTVSVVDLATNAVVDTIAVTTPTVCRLSDVAVSPAGKVLYVVCFSGSVVVFDTASDQVLATIPSPDEDYSFEHIALAPDGRSAYVTSGESLKVYVIDTATNQVVTTIPNVLDPYLQRNGLVFSPDGAFAYVVWTEKRPYDRVGFVSIIDTANRSVIESVEVGLGTGAIAASPDGTRAYIAGPANAGLTVFDTTRRELHAVVPLGRAANGIAISPVQPAVYVAVADDGLHGPGVAVVDAGTNRLGEIIPLPAGANPSSIAMHPNGRFAYVTLADPVNELVVVDTAAKAITASVAVGQDPFAATIGRAPASVRNDSNGGCAISLAKPGVTAELTWLLPVMLLAWGRRRQTVRAS
jgi:YVTN family beta-propeller protein